MIQKGPINFLVCVPCPFCEGLVKLGPESLLPPHMHVMCPWCMGEMSYRIRGTSSEQRMLDLAPPEVRASTRLSDKLEIELIGWKEPRGEQE